MESSKRKDSVSGNYMIVHVDVTHNMGGWELHDCACGEVGNYMIVHVDGVT